MGGDAGREKIAEGTNYNLILLPISILCIRLAKTFKIPPLSLQVNGFSEQDNIPKKELNSTTLVLGDNHLTNLIMGLPLSWKSHVIIKISYVQY